MRYSLFKIFFPINTAIFKLQQSAPKMSSERQINLVFIPLPVKGHIVSTLETAKLLVDRNKRLTITILLMKLPVDAKVDDSFTKNPSCSQITFVHLPRIEHSSMEPPGTPESFVHRFVESQKCLVRDAVVKATEGSKSNRLAGFVIDMFCTPMIDVANEFGVPTYVAFTSGAATLGLMFHLQSLRDEFNQDAKEYENSEVEISIPAYVNPFPSKSLPSPVFNEDGVFLSLAKRFREAKGILINTFLEFESQAIESLSNDARIPPVYPTGPVIHATEDNENREKQDEIFAWLDEQPDSFVVFLCFGSAGCFEENQVKEIAVALEKSGYRFLWSLRKPPPKEKAELPGEYKDFNEVLPEGFLQRTSGRGKVIGWAPQMAVLSRNAVGGFVSHCGWNSTLESVWCGVPMAVWPLAAEQHANAFQLVKELGIAVEIKMDYRKNSGVIVEAQMIEKGIRELMDPENEIRGNVKLMKKESRRAVVDGGTSFDYLDRFVETVVNNVS